MAAVKKEAKIPEFMMRVHLPPSSGFHSSPSGDTEYEEAYQGAILAALPEGFEVCWPRLNQKWPKDSEGHTWVLIRCTDEKNAVAKWKSDALRTQQALMKAHELARQILGTSP